nr:T9SS type A sorting domain-containing protein [Bacteroidota bacterium]
MAPCIDLTNVVSPVLKMWYHAYGSAIGWFHVDVFGDSEVVFDVIEPIVGNQGDEWKELNIDLSPWSGQVIGLRFRGITGGGEKGDFAIDDIAITDVTTVRNNLTENDKLSVFPNPSSGLVNVSVTDAGTDRCQFKVFDMYGREIMIGYVAPIDGRINISFDLSEYSNGLYIIEVKSGNGTYQAKLTKR